MFDHLLESSRSDDSNKWYNIGFGEEIGIIEIQYAPYLEPSINGDKTLSRKHKWNLKSNKISSQTHAVNLVNDNITLELHNLYLDMVQGFDNK